MCNIHRNTKWWVQNQSFNASRAGGPSLGLRRQGGSIPRTVIQCSGPEMKFDLRPQTIILVEQSDTRLQQQTIIYNIYNVCSSPNHVSTSQVNFILRFGFKTQHSTGGGVTCAMLEVRNRLNIISYIWTTYLMYKTKRLTLLLLQVLLRRASPPH